MAFHALTASEENKMDIVEFYRIHSIHSIV